MTTLKLALLRLNLNRHQVEFWEAKIQHAITLAATTEQWDALQTGLNTVEHDLDLLQTELQASQTDHAVAVKSAADYR